jgi:hypothetical protein
MLTYAAAVMLGVWSAWYLYACSGVGKTHRFLVWRLIHAHVASLIHRDGREEEALHRMVTALQTPYRTSRTPTSTNA